MTLSGFVDWCSGEKAEERWNPTQSVESILLSIISLLNDPNCSSPANVDAGVMYRQDRESYDRIVKQQVEESKKRIPLEVQTKISNAYEVVVHRQEMTPDDDFWGEEEESFGHLTDDDE